MAGACCDARPCPCPARARSRGGRVPVPTRAAVAQKANGRRRRAAPEQDAVDGAARGPGRVGADGELWRRGGQRVGSGPVFEYVHGNFSLHTPVETASTSKWPTAMMFAGLVEDGTIASLDSYCSDYVPWWGNDKASSMTQCKGSAAPRQPSSGCGLLEFGSLATHARPITWARSQPAACLAWQARSTWPPLKDNERLFLVLPTVTR